MKRAIRSFLIPALIAASSLVAFGQQPNSSSNAQQTEPDPSVPVVLQSKPWTDPDAIKSVNDVRFDLNVYEVVQNEDALRAAAQWLKDHPDVKVNLAGYADPRGDVVYNLVLAQQRANTVKQKLMEMGVPESRIVFATGWGKLYQTCLESDEQCWQRNRSVQLEYATPGGPTR
jgi:peptidoglycan-associated lipoprotein